MLKFLRKDLNKQKKNKLFNPFIGDILHVIYRFNGSFLITGGFCSYFRLKTLGLILKRKSFCIFFNIIKLNIFIQRILESYLFNKLKYKSTLYFRKVVKG